MIGIAMEELKDRLINGHEAEFVYKGCEYSFEMRIEDGKKFIDIWKCSEEPWCIANSVVEGTDGIDTLLKKRCFEGKSFYDIESEVIIETVF